MSFLRNVSIGLDGCQFVQAAGALVFNLAVGLNDEGVTVMATKDTDVTGVPEAAERIPVMQRVLDNPFLLLFLGVTIPTVFYLLWGVMEVASIPIAK